MLGAVLGNYRVLGQLGEGGMGVVYVGRHEKLGQRVVVKVLRAELSSDAVTVQRFFNEAQAATAIQNPGIAQVFDVGMTDDGHAYIIMELLKGETLAARLKQRRLDPETCCRIGRQIANVLAAAHAAGITHRDLKPDNLFLVTDAEVVGGERVKVLDFGIAKLTGDPSGMKTGLGVAMGTPRYMAPEQCRDASAADARSDIYALGGVLFKMACGRPPFIEKDLVDLFDAQLSALPPDPQRFAPDLPPPLGQLILRMLEKAPAARPQTMAEVSQALDEILRALGRAPARVSSPPRLPGLPPEVTPPVPVPSAVSARMPSPSPPTPTIPPPIEHQVPPVPVRPDPMLDDETTRIPAPPASGRVRRVTRRTADLRTSTQAMDEQVTTLSARPLAPSEASTEVELPAPPVLRVRPAPAEPLLGAPEVAPAVTLLDAPEVSTAVTRPVVPALPLPPAPVVPASLHAGPLRVAPAGPLRAAPASSTAVAGPLLPVLPVPPEPDAPGPLRTVPKSSTAVALQAPPMARSSSSLAASRPGARPSGTLTATISDAAGMAGRSPRRLAASLLLVIGGVAIIGALAGTSFVLVRRSSRGAGGAISFGEIAASPRGSGAGKVEVAVLAPSPTPAAQSRAAQPAPAAPAGSAAGHPPGPAATPAQPALLADGARPSPPAGAGDPAAECERLQLARKWSDLAQCAGRLEPRDPKRAEELRTRAAEEARSAPRIAGVEAALRGKSLKQAWAELAQVWPASVDYPSLRRRYDLAEARAIEELAAQLERVKDSACEEHAQLLAREQAAAPPRVAAEAARRAGCTPRTCNAEALADVGQEHYVMSRLAEALVAYEAAYACHRDPRWTEKAFVIACNLADRDKARLHWGRLPALRRSRVLVICERNGINEQALGAP